VRRGQTRALAGLVGGEPVAPPHHSENEEEEEPELAEAAA
jgi:hypothetical protein